jgi:hypothetical protein
MGWNLTNIGLIVAAAFFIDLSVVLVDLVGSCGFKLGCTSWRYSSIPIFFISSLCMARYFY